MDWNDLGVSIRAVPGKRRASLARLCLQVARFAPHYTISFHQSGRTVPDSYADALTMATTGKRWGMQFEEDAFLCPDFAALALSLIEQGEQRGLPLLSFYSGRRVQRTVSPVPVLEVLAGARFLMAQCLLIRSELVAEHNRFMLDFTAMRPYATDTATAAWLKERGSKFGRSWPSLVQHDDGGESLYGHKPNPNRIAPSFTAAFGPIP